MNNQYKIISIIVTYNALEWIDRCLNSLKQSIYPVDVFIIDNGSKDETVAFIKHNYPQYLLVESKVNLGFGGANNIGLKYAIENHYDYVYLLNQDAWIFPDTISKLIRAFNYNKGFGIISPMQYSNNGTQLDAAFEKIYSKYMNKEDLIQVPFVMAAHWFIPTEAVKKVGGFSPTFFHYGEDNNMIDRMRFHGFKIGIYKLANAIHDRLDRPTSRKKEIYLKKTSNLIRLSSPLTPIWKSVLKGFILSVAFSFIMFNYKPLCDYINLLRDISSIKNNRNLSINQNTPFL